MNEQEIRDNAPDGSDYYDVVEKIYYKQRGKDLWRWIGKWLYMSNCEDGRIYVLGMMQISYVNPYN